MRDLSFFPRSAFAPGTFMLLAAGWIHLALAGNPPVPVTPPEPLPAPEEAFHLPLVPSHRNPQHRFGAQGGLIFGVRAEFVSDAFTGRDVTVVPGTAPENVTVHKGRASGDENGGLGGELFYEHVMDESDLLSEGVNEVWGIHFGVGFQQLEFQEKSTLNAFRTAGASNPPRSPSFLGQGSMVHDLEADLWYVNVGLFKESYLTDRLYAKVGGGLSAAYMDATYTLSGPFDFAPESNDEQDLLFGGYLDLTLGYDLSRNWALYTGIRYQYLTAFEMEVAQAETEVEFNQAFMAFLGIRFSF